jgi:saccharopine dehydrogenase (NAD+, L-glutamate forming)
VSGGTWNSALLSMSRWRELRAAVRDAKDEEKRAGVPDRARGLHEGLHWEPRLSAWAVPFPMIDGSVVLRSARALPDYGTDFRYQHFVEVRKVRTLLVGAVGVAAVATLAQVPPARGALGRLLPSGAGPSEAQRERGKFRATFLADGDDGSVTTRVSGGELGYDGTAKMVVASALCLAQKRDALPDRVGVLTPAAAMGDVLRPELERDVLRFEVLSR